MAKCYEENIGSRIPALQLPAQGAMGGLWIKTYIRGESQKKCKKYIAFLVTAE